MEKGESSTRGLAGCRFKRSRRISGSKHGKKANMASIVLVWLSRFELCFLNVVL